MNPACILEASMVERCSLPQSSLAIYSLAWLPSAGVFGILRKAFKNSTSSSTYLLELFFCYLTFILLAKSALPYPRFSLCHCCTDVVYKTMGSSGGPSIPTVDLSAFTCGHDLAQRQSTAKELAEQCRLNGCVAIIGHGVPSDLLARAFAVSKQLFDLPLEDKLKAPHPEGVTPHRGYSALGREKGGAKGALDAEDQGTKESLMKTDDYKVGTKETQSMSDSSINLTLCD